MLENFHPSSLEATMEIFFKPSRRMQGAGAPEKGSRLAPIFNWQTPPPPEKNDRNTKKCDKVHTNNRWKKPLNDRDV